MGTGIHFTKVINEDGFTLVHSSGLHTTPIQVDFDDDFPKKGETAIIGTLFVGSGKGYDAEVKIHHIDNLQWDIVNGIVVGVLMNITCDIVAVKENGDSNKKHLRLVK